MPPLASRGALTCSAFLGEITYRIVYCDGAHVIVRVSDGTVSPGGVPQSGSIFLITTSRVLYLQWRESGRCPACGGVLTFVGPTRTSCPGMTHMTHVDPYGSLWIFVEDPGSSHVRLIYRPERAKILLRAIHSYLSPSSSCASRSSKASSSELRQESEIFQNSARD